MGDKADVWQGTLALMVLKTIATMGPLHGYGIARRIEQTSGNLLSLNYGTLYPALLKLEQEGAIASDWGVSENNRKAKFYRLTKRRTEAAREGIEALGAGDRRPRAIPRDGGPVMKHLRAAVVRLIGLVSRERRERAFDDELDSHLQMHIDDNLRAGMSAEEARRRALLKLGGVESTRQAYRERSSVPLLEHLAQDLRFALRQLTKTPGFTATAIITLALGMGAAVAIYAFVDAALVAPLPYRDPDAPGLCRGEHAADPAVEPVLSRLPRLEAAEHRVHLARRLRRTRLGPGHPGRRRAGAGRARERRLLPHARRRARAGPRLLRGRGPAWQARDAHHHARVLALPLRRAPRHRRPGGRAQRRAAHHRRGPARAFSVRARGARRVLDAAASRRRVRPAAKLPQSLRRRAPEGRRGRSTRRLPR